VVGSIFSSDARSVLFQSGDPSGGDAQLYRYDRYQRQQRAITSEPRSAMRPVLSHDGRWLAFATHADSGTFILKIRDIERGTELAITSVSERDVHEAASASPVPGYAFVSSGADLVVAVGGKLWRIDVASGVRREIHFDATVSPSKPAS
jgi:hypothetical protein